MTLERERSDTGPVTGDAERFRHEIDTCERGLRRLTLLVPPPLDAIEALLLARGVAEHRLREHQSGDSRDILGR